jgi:hypothetical protein
MEEPEALAGAADMLNCRDEVEVTGMVKAGIERIWLLR